MFSKLGKDTTILNLLMKSNMHTKPGLPQVKKFTNYPRIFVNHQRMSKMP